ncbi:ChaN family lipoprotein [Pseudobacteriovorax antillogorgiicola]|uniref:Haem-binding uptake, Tiki superfamily, ChaN n=1 Tax=Pseudobacteriovorax antillogorgiicola TaxID=1513793 RepID=A0A1Y6CKK5_9BACT|nr:ChaN family lipoprotein [Pseudobacteriovorax antillogorgiicola]TCS46128.1 heme-binding uptake protein ChaN (Tiki superfamily) [Pseudobacteriovorax antillogorgiicola]SMF69598.1 Haem-binding uptake, Tiki superfamily, ChaN [Pseudobacteriovorax antillogorgiicola]
MSKQTNLRLYEFHKSLYEKALQEASSHAPYDAPSVIKYSKEFYNSLPKTYKRTDLNTILKRLHDSDILLFGDFHTHRQTQKGLIRILEAYGKIDPERQMVLAMEMFRATDQESINAYLREQISEDELLKQCDYDEHWGFPWENYRLVVEFARENSIQIIGINTDMAGKDRLPKRDRFAAHILGDVIQGYPECLCACLIGEYHLADNHLPVYLDQEIRSVRILTNIDEFYFTRANYEEYASTEYINLKPNMYCILNSPPWIKWQSYSMWEEMKSAQEDYDPSILYTEEAFDIDYQIVSIMGHLTEFLDISLKESDLSNFHSYCELTSKDFTQLRNDRQVSNYTKSLMEARLAIDGIFYIPETRFALLEKQTLNSIAELAGQILFCILHPPSKDMTLKEAFTHRVIMISAGILASKTLNPRRKSPDIHQFESDLKRMHRKKLSEGDRIYREALRYTIKLYYRLLLGRSRIDLSIINRDMRSSGIYSLMIGQLLGMETYQSIMNPKKAHINFSDLFQFSNQDISITKVYRSLIRFLFQT